MHNPPPPFLHLFPLPWDRLPEGWLIPVPDLMYCTCTNFVPAYLSKFCFSCCWFPSWSIAAASTRVSLPCVGFCRGRRLCHPTYGHRLEFGAFGGLSFICNATPPLFSTFSPYLGSGCPMGGWFWSQILCSVLLQVWFQPFFQTFVLVITDFLG
jgi:hypothetical protein